MQTTSSYHHKIGENVVYRKQGIYKITGIKEQRIAGIKKDYYVLSSVYDTNSSVYVPVDSEVLTAQMERLLSKDEIHAIIDESENCGVIWIDNTAERAEYLDEIIKSGNLSRILAVLKMFVLRRKSTDKKGARSFAHDEKIYTAVQKTVTEAFAFPLGLDRQEVIPYITQRLNKA